MLVKQKNFLEAEKVQTMLKAKEKEFEIARAGTRDKKRDQRHDKAKKALEELQKKHELELYQFLKGEAFVIKSFKDN